MTSEKKDTYVLAAFRVDTEKSTMYRKYKTTIGLARGVKLAMDNKADYVSIRRIRPKVKEK